MENPYASLQKYSHVLIAWEKQVKSQNANILRCNEDIMLHLFGILDGIFFFLLLYYQQIV